MEIGKNYKVQVAWKVKPEDYNDENEKEIKSKIAQKYNISKDNVSIEPKFIKKNERGEDVALTNDIIENIQQPQFQQKLFEEFIKDNGIENYDIEEINGIDNRINNLIDYTVYEKYKRYSIKWIKWSNFLSYGEDNFFDFSQLKGLVLLNGSPANYSGKSTFGYDLLHFMLFGNTTKNDCLQEVFNRYRPEATEVVVEGCIIIDNNEYIIKRTLTRPALKKRTEKSIVKQKIEYYQIINNENVELADDTDNLEGETVRKTNKIIKDAIGDERDFNLIISANSDNLKALVGALKSTERGQLFNRWIGLLPLEEKDKIARDMYNKEVFPKFLMSRYSKETLSQEIKDFENETKEKESIKEKNKTDIANSDVKIKLMEDNYKTLLSSKKNIDENLTKTDVNTVINNIKRLIKEGTDKNSEIEKATKELADLGDVSFDEKKHNDILKRDKDIFAKINTLNSNITRLKKEHLSLENAGECPMCHCKIDKAIIDNHSQIIKNNEEEIKKLTNESLIIKQEIAQSEENRRNTNKKSQYELFIGKLKAERNSLVADYKINKKLQEDFVKNENAIRENNKINNEINILNVNLETERNFNSGLVTSNIRLDNQIENNKNEIAKRTSMIEVIKGEEKTNRNWKIYLGLVGKNGISKIVLRTTLPLINSELKRILDGVTDFNITVEINDKNEVEFYIIKDGMKGKLKSGSGFELTASSLALRSVLYKISSMPKVSMMILDEILNGVATENYEKIKLLYDKIIKDYQFIFHITHLENIIDWHNQIVTVTKENNVSTVTQRIRS